VAERRPARAIGDPMGASAPEPSSGPEAARGWQAWERDCICRVEKLKRENDAGQPEQKQEDGFVERRTRGDAR